MWPRNNRVDASMPDTHQSLRWEGGREGERGGGRERGVEGWREGGGREGGRGGRVGDVESV